MADYDRSIHNNPDARAWAREFLRTAKEHPEVSTDEGTMIGWFANAMMAMHDAGPVRRPSLEEARGIAARCWCRPETSGIEMDVRLAEVFAQLLAFGEPSPSPSPTGPGEGTEADHG